MNEPVVTAAPADTPVSLTELKTYLRVDDDTEDALLDAMIKGGVETAETYLGRSLITQMLRQSLDYWPARQASDARFPWFDGPRIVELARPPVQSIVAVTVYDQDDQSSVIASSAYRLANGSNDRARLVLHKGQSWAADLRPTDAIAIDYIAGYGDTASDVPEPIRQGLMALIGFWFEHRDGAAWQTALPPLPIGAASLWRPYRLMGFGR